MRIFKVDLLPNSSNGFPEVRGRDSICVYEESYVRMVSTKIPDLMIVELESFQDERGTFTRAWDAESWEAHGIGPFVQDNVSVSVTGVLRGLHFQRTAPQGKLVSVMAGSIFDVAVDIRPGSRTHGQWVGVTLTANQPRQLWVPPGFAHGFCVTAGPATVHYRCTTAYLPLEQDGLAWDDPSIGVEWPIKEPILSLKDRSQPSLLSLKDRSQRSL
jgi:dTDP-4-dehydrorhamnose 3,5-epimerase